MNEWQRTEDYLYSPSEDGAYQTYALQEPDGEDPLSEEFFIDEVMEYAKSEETEITEKAQTSLP